MATKLDWLGIDDPVRGFRDDTNWIGPGCDLAGVGFHATTGELVASGAGDGRSRRDRRRCCSTEADLRDRSPARRVGRFDVGVASFPGTMIRVVSAGNLGRHRPAQIAILRR